MREFMYGIDSGVIAVALLLSMVVVVEIGYRLGLRVQHRSSEESRSHINAIQGSMLGILALLLGFTFSQSLQRFDSRSEAVVEEANAIGTAWLRTQMLPAAIRADVQAALREYTETRVQATSISQIERATEAVLTARALALQDRLWQLAMRAVDLDPHPLKTGLYVQALNEAIDQYGKRDAALNRHVPELVLGLLYLTFLMAGATVGLGCGVAGHRPSLGSYIMVALIVVLVFIILDLDRPRRGLIEVSQKSLVDLQLSMRK